MDSRQSEREAAILRYLRAVRCDYTGSIAESVGIPLSTTRRLLEAMETRGLVDGRLHDERNTGGRRRVYWNAEAA